MESGRSSIIGARVSGRPIVCLCERPMGAFRGGIASPRLRFRLRSRFPAGRRIGVGPLTGLLALGRSVFRFLARAALHELLAIAEGGLEARVGLLGMQRDRLVHKRDGVLVVVELDGQK